MLFQLHHLHEGGRHEFVAQTEFPDDLKQAIFNRRLYEWVEGVKKRHSLPEGPGWIWFCRNQEAPKFMWAAPPQENPDAGCRQSEPLGGDDERN